MHRRWHLRAWWLVVAAGTISSCIGQSSTAANAKTTSLAASEQAICGDSIPGAKAALRLVCLDGIYGVKGMSAEKTIVIGFVGGFVHRSDMRHPEVQLAALLREAYPSLVHAEVFANHNGQQALRRVVELLSEDGDGVLTASARENARIILYGHSWGASQVLTLSAELDRLGIPVSLAVLIDSVHKPGHNDAVIPPNVRNAVNFYQTRGIIHGRASIRAADPERTHFMGNFEMSYQDHPIDCDNYPWIVRHLNKPHHEIENDPVVWQQVMSMINSELLQDVSAMEASLPTAAFDGK